MFTLLYYYNGGFNYTDINNMSVADRRWFIDRVVKQKQDESAEIEAARGKNYI